MKGSIRGLRVALSVTAMLALASGPVLAVGAQTVTVGTEVHNAQHVAVTSISVGSYVHPSFVVSGASGTPTGQISVLKWNNGTCSGTRAYAYGGLLTNGALDATFLAETSMDSTTISYRGDYKGDAVYGPMTGPCRSLTFTKATASVGLQLHDANHHAVTSVHIGDVIHAYVDVVSRVADGPTGSVKIYAWPGGACSGAASIVGPYALAGGSVDTPYLWTMGTVGSYAFRASYSGDSTYNAQTSSCVVVTVTKYVPTFVTDMHDSKHQSVDSVAVNEPVHPVVHLSGQLGTPTGAVKISRYSTSDCSGPAQFSTGPAAAAVMDPAAEPFALPFVGVRSFKLVYTGDTNYASATSCLLVTWRAQPTVTLDLRSPSDLVVSQPPVGTDVHPRVAVTQGFGTATGSVTVRYFLNGTCTGGATLGTRTLSGGVVDDGTLDLVLSTVTLYSFKAAYAGDASNEPASSPCVQVNVTPTPAPKPTPTPKPTPKPTPTPTGAVVVPAASVGPSGAPAATAAPSQTAGQSLNPPTDAPGSSAGPATTANSSSGPVVAGPVSQPIETDTGGSTWLFVLIGLGLLVLVTFWVVTSRRRRRRATTA